MAFLPTPDGYRLRLSQAVTAGAALAFILVIGICFWVGAAWILRESVALWSGRIG